VRQKRDEIAIVTSQLRDQRANVLAQAREQALQDLRVAENTRNRLTATKLEQERLVTEQQNASVEYNILRRDVETNQKLYEGIMGRLREAGIAPGIELGDAHVLEPAMPDPTVARPKVLWNLLIASVLGITLGFCLAIVLDFWHGSIGSVEDLEQVSGLPVLSAIPQQRRRRVVAPPSTTTEVIGLATGNAVARASTTRVDISETFAGAESIRSLCAAILLSQSNRPPKTIVVTSSAPGDGKTTVALQMARAMAETGARTLLVECDLRRPTFTEAFGIDQQGGLSLCLSGHVSHPRIHKTPYSGLFVVGAGPAAPNPVALLNSVAMSTFLQSTADTFNFVILDTPPALPMADARIVGAKADGVIIVVRAGVTPGHALKRVQQALERTGSRVLGTVLNGTDRYGLSSYHYYGQENSSA
jgi:capsular exopolysaccharide synthesis family protein